MKIMIRKFEILDDQKAFSLMELMIVLAIIGIMAAISIPLMNDPENRSRKAARDLMGDMQRTRMSAIKNNQTWGIVFITAENRYKICSGPGADGVWSAHADNPTQKTVDLTVQSSGILYGNGVATVPVAAAFGDGVTYTSNVLTFDPQGTCGNGYVYLFFGNSTYAIGTFRTGIVRIFRWDGGGWG